MSYSPNLLPMVLPPSDAQGRTDLHWAASRNDVTALNAGVQRGLSIDASTVQGWTPLHFALNARALNAVEASIRLGADVNRANVRGRTPLVVLASVWANHENDRKMLDLLLAAGADINTVGAFDADDGPHSLLHEMALRDKDGMLVEVLGRRSLHMQAAPLGCFSIEEEMIFNPNTALAFTHVFLRTPGFVERLIGRYDLYGNSILHHLVRTTELPTAAWRELAEGMLLDLPNHNGATALHIATSEQKTGWQATLLELGANPSVLDENGRMAWPEAVEMAQELDAQDAQAPNVDLDPIVRLAVLQAALSDSALPAEDLSLVRDEIQHLQARLRHDLAQGTHPQPVAPLTRNASGQKRLDDYVRANRDGLMASARRLMETHPPASLLSGLLTPPTTSSSLGQSGPAPSKAGTPNATLRERRFAVFNQAPRFTDQDVKQKRFAYFEQGLPCWVPEIDVWSWQESMDADFPWMKEVTARLVRWMVVKQHNHLVVTWPNLVLMGASGSGKTLYWKTAFERLGQPRMMLSMGGTNDSAMIRGTAKGWANAEPGLALNALGAKGVINPVIVLDDLDKLVGSDSNGNAHEALQPLLERSSSKNYLDNFLNMEIDVSRLSWVGTVTDEERLPKSLRDRFEFVEVSGPNYSNPQHFAAVLATAQRLAREEWGFDQAGEGPVLSDEALRILRSIRWQSLRSFSKKVEDLLGQGMYHDAIEAHMDKAPPRSGPSEWWSRPTESAPSSSSS